MTPRTGLVFAILPLPVLAAGAAATAAGFLGAGVPGGRLAGLGVATVVVEGGVRWGSLVGALLTFAAGIAAIWWSGRRAPETNPRRGVAPAFAVSVGGATALGALLGAGLGARLVARLPIDAVVGELRDNAALVGPCVVVGVVLAGAAALRARTPADPG